MDNRLLLAFYGDDFTGSTDAMEALDRFGLRTILFLDVPSKERIEQFKDVQCIGIAGTARAKQPSEMKKELVPVLEKCRELQPRFVHYKVCSTFDSSPEVGSIGFVCELAKQYFPADTYPLLVATPDLGRYTVFGNHFAAFHGEVYRLDQHPVMSRHPVTPMDEADLGRHLQKQTELSIGYRTIIDMDRHTPGDHDLTDKDVTIYDASEPKHMDWFSEELWKQKGDSSQFIVGSSGVEYAFASKWKKEGLVQEKQEIQKANSVEQMLVVSGSVSAVTKKQLERAEAAGFHMVQVPYKLIAEDLSSSYMDEILQVLQKHKKVVLYTAKGHDDPAIAETKAHLTNMGVEKEDIGMFIGKQLGVWTKYLMEHADLKRLVVSGGDTSGFVTSQLGIYGLEVLESIAPGAPLCHAYSEESRFDGLEIALKSGQLGGEDFFENVFLAGEK